MVFPPFLFHESVYPVYIDDFFPEFSREADRKYEELEEVEDGE
jgi:hypothetical protein